MMSLLFLIALVRVGYSWDGLGIIKPARNSHDGRDEECFISNLRHEDYCHRFR